jgi:3-hydroxyisobutyrate dehydrogenase-like beta-hydroxyacid dehydrogenase
MLDAPVSAGVAAAKTASLAFFVGGEAKLFERVRPLLELMGSGYGEQDTSSLLLVLEQMAGRK